MKPEKHEIHGELLAACETVKSKSLSYPNRASILGLLGAALVANVAATDGLSYHLDAQLRAHLRDALKPLGFTVKRAANRHAPHHPDEL